MARATRRRQPDADRLLTTAEVLDRYRGQISRRTLDRLVAAGTLPVYKRPHPSRPRYFDPDDIEALFVPSVAEPW